jgi:hypothetical protein
LAPAWGERNLRLNLPPGEVEHVNQILGTALTREELIDLIQDRLTRDFGWNGLVYVGESYASGRDLYVPSEEFFQLNGIFSFEELTAYGQRVGGLSSGHVGRVSIPEIGRVARAKNLNPQQVESVLCNLVLHEWIGHGVSDSSAFHGTPPMGPSIRGMLPGIADEVLHFRDECEADHQLYRKIRMNLDM